MSAGTGLVSASSVFKNGHANGGGSGSFDFGSLSKAVGYIDNDEEEVLSFESPDEKAGYYENKYHESDDKYRTAMELLTETREELDEFQISSRELEKELEKEIEETEKREQGLKERIRGLEGEKDELKTKYVKETKEHGSTVAAMQREMDNLRSERDKAMVAVRDLEMGNDELERNERVAASSLLDMEIKYNRAIEDKTLLEQEVIQRNELEEECQRLKDDVRDANNEIAILRDQLARAVVPTPPASDAPMSPISRRTLHSRADSARSAQSARSDASSPTPTDYSQAGTLRSTVTPRGFRVAGRVARSTSTPTGLTPTGITSPSGKRASSSTIPSSPSMSGIPSLSRSTANRNIAAYQTPLAVSTANRRVLAAGAGASTSTAGGRPPSAQATKTKGFKLLHDLQARIKTTDDKLGKMVKKGPVGFARRPAPAPAAAPGSFSSASVLSASTMRARAASRSRAFQPASILTASTATITPITRDRERDREERASGDVGVLSPTSWVLLAESDETPPGTPESPLERTRRISTTTRRGTLPPRPSIPSPLVRETKARHVVTDGIKARNGLSASMIAPARPRPLGRPSLGASTSRPLSSSTLGPLGGAAARPPSSSSGSVRAPSRGHVRAASSISSMSTSLRSGAASPRRLSIGPDTLATLSRPPSRAAIPSRSHTPTRSHTPSGSMGSLPLGFGTVNGSSTPVPPVPARRPARRSSMGVDDGAPPTAIPGPKSRAAAGAGLSASTFGGTPPPPVPRLPSQVRRVSDRADRGHAF